MGKYPPQLMVSSAAKKPTNRLLIMQKPKNLNKELS
jgi:hypothetical protein